MSGSESEGQEAACMHTSGLCNDYSELFTWMAGLNIYNAVAQPLLQLLLSL